MVNHALPLNVTSSTDDTLMDLNRLGQHTLRGHEMPRKLWIIALTCASLVGVLFWFWLAKTVEPSTTAAPSPTASSPAETPVKAPIEPKADNESVVQMKNQFNDRVRLFETAMRSFDYQQPDQRATVLKSYMLPETLKQLLQAEQRQKVARQRMIDARTVKTVTSVEITSGEIEDDLASMSSKVSVHSEQEGLPASDVTYTSRTRWVKTKGEWYVYEIALK